MKKAKYRQIQIRFSSEEEIEILDRFKSTYKSKKESFNQIAKKILLEQMQNIMYNKELSKNQNIIKDVLNDILDKNIIPRVSGMVKTINEQNFIKIELLNKKVNFLISELGQNKMIDGRPIINDINLRTKEKSWMLEEELKINNQIQIKKN